MPLLSILDLVRVTQDADARTAMDNARDLAAHAETWDYNRIWIAEHHNMAGIASAATSLVIAKALTQHGAGKLHSYDQHAPFVAAMGTWLAEHALTAAFHHAPLGQRDVRWPGLWYNLTAVPGSIDLLVIDGPPWAVHPFARGMAERLFPLIAPGGMVLLDDAARPGERYVAHRWKKAWPEFDFHYENGGTKGTLVGRRRA